jgi:hypothetical protein
MKTTFVGEKERCNSSKLRLQKKCLISFNYNMTLTTILTTCKSSTTLQGSNQITQKRSKLSSVRKRLAVLRGTIKTQCFDVSATSTTSCRSFSSKDVALDETQSVRFSYVEIREYGRVLVDHPECQDGLGLGLDWKYSRKMKKLSLECYEAARRRKGKHEKNEFEKVCTYDKKMLLKEIGGCSEKELWEAFCIKLKDDVKRKSI